jgi:hypothetical protein
LNYHLEEEVERIEQIVLNHGVQVL